MRNGVPKSKSSYINSEYSEEALDALFGLPQSWRDFVNAGDMSDSETKIQSAIWELVSTEAKYIQAIQTVTDVSIKSFLLLKIILCYQRGSDAMLSNWSAHARVRDNVSRINRWKSGKAAR